MPFLFTCDGFAYACGTASLATLPTDAGGEITGDLTLVAGALDWVASRLAWTERMHPLDGGELETDQQTFVLNDLVVSSGPASGHNLFTWMVTRAPGVLTSTTLAGGASGTNSNLLATDASFTVADGSAFPASGVCYVDAEAISYTRSGNTFTVVARGRYMSAAVTHYIDVDGAVYPEVWADFPFVARRRVVAWYVDPGTNVATALWRGFAQRAPRLRANASAQFEWQSESLWQVEKARTLVDANASCRLRGFNAKGFSLAVTGPLGDTTPTVVGMATDQFVYNSVQDLFNDGAAGALYPTLASRVATGIPSMTGVTITFQDLGGQWQWTFQNSGPSPGLAAYVGAYTNPVIRATATGSAPWTVRLTQPTPSAMVVGSSVTPCHIPVDSVFGLPATWTPAGPYTETDGSTTAITPVLRGVYNDAIAVVINPVATGTATSFYDAYFEPSGQGPSVFGTLTQDAPTLQARPHGYAGLMGTLGSGDTDGIFVDTALLMRYTVHVQAGNWVYAVQRVISDTQVLRTGSDPRNYDFSNVADLVAATASSIASRDYYLDGTRTVGGLLAELCTLNGCGVAYRGSKLSIVAFRRAMANERVVAAFTRADLVPKHVQTLETFPDGIANVATVTSSGDTLAVREGRSIGKFGVARNISVDVTGLPLGFALRGQYAEFQRLVLARVLFLWNNPLAVVHLPVQLAFTGAVFQGDFVSITEDLLPDGAGSRGLGNAAALAALGINAQVGQVIGRTVDVPDGTLWLQVLLTPFAYGYSPAVRLASISGADATCASAFVRGAGDYADAVSQPDAGARFFAPGDRVRLLQRDVTTLVTEDLVVQSVTGSVIKFASTPAAHWATDLAGGAWVDLIYSPRGTAGVQADQTPYAWCGSATAGVIGGTTQPNQQWAP